MKINWGTGIAIFYTLFVIVMVGMVIKSTYNKAQLVQEDYYNKDINYEEFRKKRQNGDKFSKVIFVDYAVSDNVIKIKFPASKKDVQGDLTLFRPSNAKMDKIFSLDFDEKGEMDIPVDRTMADGLWKVKIEWKDQGIDYYNEKDIVI